MGLFTDAPIVPPPERRRVRSPETWARARDDYAAGWSAPDVCDRHDVGLSAFRTRAREEGWRRRDQPDPEPALAEPQDDGPPPPPAELADAAYRAVARAVTRGDLRGARGWTLVARDLRRMAAEEAAAEVHASHASSTDSEAAPSHPPSPSSSGRAADPRTQQPDPLRSAETDTAPPDPPDGPRTSGNDEPRHADEPHEVHVPHAVSASADPPPPAHPPRRRNPFGIARHFQPP